MDAQDLIDKIPPIEKILGVAWIISWICAIWIYPIQFFLTGLFCLFLVLIILGVFDKKEEGLPKPPLVFSMNKNTRSLTVQKMYEDSLRWEDNEVCSGDAKLPTGRIKEGDVVTNCEGNVAFRHIPTNTLMGGYNFKKEE
jgi:hypothetical protein